MNVRLKRQIAAWLLLAVYVPMLALASLHVHGASEGYTAIECDECVQHQCHGHLIQLSGLSHVCVLCQFLTLPLVVVAAATVLLYNLQCCAPIREHYAGILSALVGVVGLRAPPAFLL